MLQRRSAGPAAQNATPVSVSAMLLAMLLAVTNDVDMKLLINHSH